MAVPKQKSQPASRQEAQAADVLDASHVRADFPILDRDIHGKKLVYLDNAASTQKPRAVIDAVKHYYERYNSNVHRGVHHLSQEATFAYEGARKRVQALLNAEDDSEIIFTRGTTEAINLVAQTYGRANLGPGDEVLISVMEHHSNIVPWQLVCEQTGATLKAVPIDEHGALVMDELERLLTEKTKIVALGHISNSLGTINPIQKIAAMAHAVSAVLVVDGAQGLPHARVDVRELDADFYAFSGHKVYGPTGIGGLYGRRELLDAMPPWQGGGDMILTVAIDRSTYNDPPFRFEAGTPNIAGAIGLAAALDYVDSLGYERVAAHEAELLAYGTAALEQIEDLRLIGTAPEKAGVLSFVMDGAHPHDVGTILDQEGIAIRTGHHCAQPVMEHFCVPATARASIGIYNTREDIDALVRGLRKVREVFG
ncbi:MAG: cysteine desulfurase [Planctomycetota bacterium]|nr:cysteine desulfurase [Planctomycetota bacterium]